MGKQRETYQAFCEIIVNRIEEQFAQDAIVQVNTVVKNNEVVYDALNIIVEGEKISPNFYLQQYYESYKTGDSIEEIVVAIAEAYYRSLEEREKINFNLDFASCKERIVFRLVSFSRNKRIASKVPYLPFMDMMVTFHIVMQQTKEELGSVRITREIAKKWNVDTEQLFELARQNTPRLFPVKICTMYAMMTEMMEENVNEWEGFSITPNPTGAKQEPYVVTNTMGINGAAVILYQNVLEKIADRLKGDYYILPSSIHEVLAIPMQQDLSQEELAQMVWEVNATWVRQEEIVSGSVYCYDSKAHNIELCFNEQEICG